MAKTFCPGGVWTAIPDSGGDTVLRGAPGGIWVCTDGSDPVDKREAYPLGALRSMVIKSGLPITVFPANPNGTYVQSMPV
jgi:hypothetical protein